MATKQKIMKQKTWEIWFIISSLYAVVWTVLLSASSPESIVEDQIWWLVTGLIALFNTAICLINGQFPSKD